jgi:hypothetical protein
VTSSHDLSIARVLTGRVSRHVTGVYNPKAFILHAASLRQAFAHCGRFSTAASRRSLGSVSVPVWPVNLSARLPVIALVGRYPTNKLIGHRPLREREARRSPPLPGRRCLQPGPSGISRRFQRLSRTLGQVAYALLTLSPLDSGAEAPALARLACLIHAASVRSEPGSNPSFPETSSSNGVNRSEGRLALTRLVAHPLSRARVTVARTQGSPYSHVKDRCRAPVLLLEPPHVFFRARLPGKSPSLDFPSASPKNFSEKILGHVRSPKRVRSLPRVSNFQRRSMRIFVTGSRIRHLCSPTEVDPTRDPRCACAP